MSDDEATNDGDEHGGVHPPPSLPVNQGPPFIAFSVLLDFAVQKAYQDLTILAELLPKKSDLERKTSIAQFANSTRQLFVRILAVLKWARCGAKVDMCTGIQCFLDQQASMFIDTADRLFQMCNSVLNNARLPTFQMPIAVDVLTLGTFPRLPKAIQQRFIPPEKITIDELRSVTRRLSQVVQRRVTSVLCSLPERMRNFTVKDGMVTFRVIGEFEATLTLLGQLPATPWTLLNFRLLVTDPRVTDGSELLNGHQTAYLHHYLQARMNLHKEPLTELYNLLHGFSLSVQLDLLCCQAGRLLNDYLSGNLAVDEYVRSQRLVVSYWRDASKGGAGGGGAKGEAVGGVHKLIIHVDPDAPERRLQVTHVPKSDLLLPGLRTGDRLSLEDLLSDTVLCRIRYRLGHLMDMIREGHSFRCSMEGRFPKLRIALLDNCTNDEMLYISINLFSGRFLVRISVLRKNRRCRALEDSLNKGNWTALNESLLDLRVALVTNRYVRTSQLFHMSRINQLLPAVDQTFALQPNGQRLVIQISRCEHFCLVIDLTPGGEENPDTVNVQYWALIVGRSEEEQTSAEDGADTTTYIERMELDEERISVTEIDAADFKCPPHYIRRLGSLLAISEQEAPFMALMRAFSRHGVRYRSSPSAGYCVTTLDVIGIDHGCLSSSDDASLLQSILDVASKISVRLQYDRYKIHWTFELKFFNSPLRLLTSDQVMQPIRSHQTAVTTLQSSARGTDRVVEDFLNVLRTFAVLHGPLVNLAEAMHFWPERFRCLRIILYTYHKLTFAYGPSLRHVCSVNWRSSEGAFALLFAIRPDVQDGHSINPHTLLAHHLQQWFQRRQDLVALVTVLNASLVPMVALASLPVTIGPLLSDNMHLSTVNTHVFCVIPLSPFCVRLVYKGRLALEITFLPDDQVSIRDCAPALGTQASRFMPKYVPIVGLKTFLSMHSSGVKRWQNMADGGDQQQQQGGDPVAESSSSSVGISTPPEDWTASAAPIVVKHATLTAICAPSNTMPKPEWSAIHKFLASVALLDLFKDQSNASVPRPGQLCMKLPQLELRFFVEETSLSWIALKIYVEENNDICTEADVHFLERYFATCVSPLYSYCALTSFLRILSVCKGIRRDLFANLLLLMNMQLNRYPEEGVFWLPEICFQVPPMHLLPPMLMGIVKVTQVMNTWPIVNNPTNKKILFWIKFTRVENRSHCLAFPLLYDGDTNALQIFRGATQPTGGPTGTLCAVDACLIRQHQVHQNYGDCSFWASIRDVMHTNDLLAPVNG